MNRPAKSPRPHFILMIGDEGVFFVPHKVPGALAPFFAAESDARGQKKILDALIKNPRVPATLFADTLAQDFRRETVPRLNPLDRPRLIERRLRQAFPQAGLAASLNVKHDRTQVLLAGMHGGGPVFDWLEKLRAARRGATPPIALLPVECADMAARLLPDAAPENKNGNWTLLLSRQRTGGFRQIVTHNGELIFTRLTPPLPPSAPAHEIAETVARDIKASLGYLGRLGLTGAAQLQAVLLMPEFAHAALRSAALPVRSFKLLTPRQAAWDLELPFVPEADEAYADLLFAGWLAQKRKIRLPLMPPEMKRVQRTASIREWGWRAAAASLLLAFVLTAWQAGDLFNTLMEARREAVALAALEQKLSAEQAAASPVTEPLGRLRQAVERRRLFSEPAAMPWAALGALGRGIGAARLVKLDWQSDKPADEVMQIDVKLLHGKPASLADRRAAAAQFQKLAQDVAAAMPGYDVRLVRYPFPALPGEALSNEDAAKNADDTAELEVRRIGQ